MEQKIIKTVHLFRFKRVSVSGPVVRYIVKVYVDKSSFPNVINVRKIFIDERGDLPFKILKKFKNLWLYEEEISFVEQTLIDILMNSLSVIHGVDFQISEKQEDIK